MNYSIVTIEPFVKELKRLVKKYPSLKQEIALLFKQLETEPVTGRPSAATVIKSE